MNGEFTGFCSQYYNLTERLAKENAYLQKFLDNAPFYKGETQLSEIDYILKYYRKTQEVNMAVVKTMDDLNKTAKTILAIMRHFEIPSGTVLHGVVEEEAEYDIWADESSQVHIAKTKQLAPEPDAENIITIRLGESTNVFDDEDAWFPK
ncbi:MAG: hypothetical protein JO080_14910 [Mucilaginibacter sp.]|nr:hypothetical protein [Mucilaginibacter sp.]